MPQQDLKVALIPLDIRFAEPDHNIRCAEERIKCLPNDIDLVLLPELSTTGFGTYPEEISTYAETSSGRTIQHLARLSRELDIAICGGFIHNDNGQCYNSAFMVAQGRTEFIYHKRHLFAGGEARTFAKGNELPRVITYKTWRLQPAICYDIRFPVWNRSVDNSYDALIVVANWPNSRNYAWTQLLIARAIENQSYVAGCNREGEDVYGLYGRGDSLIINALGVPVGRVDEKGTVFGTFSADNLYNDRKNIKAWRDADSFTIEL